jgi:hypothetical protein
MKKVKFTKSKKVKLQKIKLIVIRNKV